MRNLVVECDAVEKFSKDMLDKLQSNTHKRHWSKCSNSWLLRRLNEEVEELKRAMIDTPFSEEVVREAADVANFAMMIADNARRKGNAR